ncbi:hypothetical protein NL676_037693 [Syzygium grande]|nr:hypothetical protein NL676_037693 [Syzygium grande]
MAASSIVRVRSHGEQPLAQISVYEMVFALDGRASIEASPSVLGVTGKMRSGYRWIIALQTHPMMIGLEYFFPQISVLPPVHLKM